MGANKDTLKNFLIEKNLFKPNAQKIKKSPFKPLGSTMPEAQNKNNRSVSLKELSDLEDYANKWKRIAEDEETHRRKLQHERDDLKRQLDTFEAKKALEIKEIISEKDNAANSGLAGLTNPDNIERLGNTVATIMSAAAALKGANSNAAPMVSNGPNAEIVQAFSTVLSTLKPDDINRIWTIIQVYTQPSNLTELANLYNRITNPVNPH